jgi:pyruvate/2-oxoglutarate dehydrogenase complex dihydrolipoamide dehydrogenase (E3) component
VSGGFVEKYDLIVIGAGSTGSSCAEKANKSGLRVALIEKDVLGGTCLNYGCDPTKAALHSAKVLFQAKHSNRYGLAIEQPGFHWPDLQAHIWSIVDQIRGGPKPEAREQMRQRGIDLFMGTAVFVSATEIEVDGRVLTADNIVIATGAKPNIPPVPGLDKSGYLTNMNVFDVPFLPESLAIMGGGPIGVEFAQFFARLGTKVLLFEPLPQILPKDDPDLAAELAGILEQEGVEIHTGAEVSAVSLVEDGKQLTIAYESGYEEKLVVEALLVAAGRQLDIDELDIDQAGVKLKDGRIQTDAALRTNVPNIWAAGDVTAAFPFTHIAWRQGLHVAKNIIQGEDKPFADVPVPWVTYTDPELAHIGQTEGELQAAGVAYRVLEQPLEKIVRAIVTVETHGRIKLFVGDDDQILGGHILAANAGELIGPILLAKTAGLPVTSLGDTFWPYPTLSVVLGKAANSQPKSSSGE